MDLYSEITALKGVGEKTQKLLARLGIFTIENLLEYYPKNYDVYEAPVFPEEIQEGKAAAIICTVMTPPSVNHKTRVPAVTLKTRGPGRMLYMTWYNMPYLKNSIKSGETYIFRGTPVNKRGSLTVEQPEIFTPEEYKEKLNSMQPVYPLTEGVSNKLLIRLIGQALDGVDLSREFLPDPVRRKYKLAEYNFALRQIHFPKDWEQMLTARRRLVFDEFFVFALAIQSMKEQTRQVKNHYPMAPASFCDDLIAGLPYQLTGAQMRTWKEIQADMASENVMNRLIQGDVGSGKTVIAALALLQAAQNGFQGCIMAPTEVLARQHYESFVQLFEPFHVRVTLLTGSMTAREKRTAYEKIAAHETDIIVGTHALIQEKAVYDRLALVVTDEQHRFGVRQREFLSGKGETPHVLVMSATPIPRTLAIILYGDLDISVIDELPARRLPVKNCVVGTSYRKSAYRFIEQQVRQGHQVYVICPMVEESEMMEAENVVDYTARLKEALPSDICIEYLHGKQKPKEKNEIMERFGAGQIQVLVSTTVVEVGVNVPNATVMMIEDAQRFGLAQLHQLRGRVGRGDAQSYCIFVNTSDKKSAQERLEVLVKSNDGFFIAGEDLKLRGPGDLFGLKQSGIMEFKIGDIFNDMDLLKEATQTAKALIEKDEQLKLPQHKALRDKLDRYMRTGGDSLVL
ncbi:MAG TPA: ATP-dependent DNA helicase RecG [Candidatus Scybalocola faecigallinarum]|uniref:ATP-dependent DNA helicase RecG n=1 Tax=Candidatus Scybalocola faecigallinarum TaxID=2840941 RepID=A0A9D1F5P5_9FIRM|nr:ATP-dependent DNA helicase RecG [Candidatus Scybalocola faecigallinarum]